MNGWDDARDTVRTGSTPLGELGVPELLAGRYRILERVGQGGMGIVCRGFDLDLEEIVAVKFLRADVAEDDTLRTRFRREVKLARRVTHPHVARVFEFGRDGPLCFLTMEFVPGDSLLALLHRAGRLSPGELHALATGLCQGLAAAHDAGVVHGDIKPGNILVAPGRGAVLTDFGIAQALADPCLANETSGTPFYMAPEQARSELLGPQADVYAVGVVLFEALTGTSPWPENDTMGLLAYKRDGQEPALIRLAPDLAPEWLQLIAACLHNDPRQRPSDAQALLTRLALLPATALASRDLPVVLATAAAREPARALAAGPRWLEVCPLTHTPPELAWIAADLTDALAQTRGLRVRTTSGAGDPAGPSILRIEARAHEIADGVRVLVRVTSEEPRVVHSEFTLDQPRAQLHRLGAELAARVAASLDQQPAPTREDVLDADVSELYVQARHAYLSVHLDRAIDLYRAALARAPDNTLLRVNLTIARIHSAMFRDPAPGELVELQAAAEDAVVHHGELGESHLARARVRFAMGDGPGTARSLCDAIARAPSLVEAYVMLADILIDIGRLPDAVRRLDIALALDSSSAHAWSCRARQFAYQGRWDEFYAVPEACPGLGGRGALLPRLMLWHPRPAAVEALERSLRADRSLPRPLWHASQRLIAFVLGRDDRGMLIEKMEPLLTIPGNLRRSAYAAQVLCELACIHGDLPRALSSLQAADRHLLTDLQWLLHCPLLVPIRQEPAFAAVRESVRARTDAIADAIWG